MRSDLYSINEEEDLEIALDEVERIALLGDLIKEEALTVRLLAEEMVGLISSVLDKVQCYLWIENKEKEFELHLRAEAFIGQKEKEELISVASTRENNHEVKITAKIAGIFENFIIKEDTGEDVESSTWSLSKYESTISQDSKKLEWDGLEKSILMNFADDILINVESRQVELYVKKKI